MALARRLLLDVLHVGAPPRMPTDVFILSSLMDPNLQRLLLADRSYICVPVAMAGADGSRAVALVMRGQLVEAEPVQPHGQISTPDAITSMQCRVSTMNFASG